ncbi:hypothetical protein DFH06DRAFT_1442027 [Mycena polygramma]|nr:hypothetical protein DFH06DRAFT_1442027 [Mycena polygramma]
MQTLLFSSFRVYPCMYCNMASLSRSTSLSILDLPTEILFVIFADEALSPQDLFSLARLCRRFHFIALTLYFSHDGLDPSTRSIQITMRSDHRDLLAALQMALFDTSLDHIDFLFPHPSSTSVFPLLQHLQRVEGFLSRHSSVKSVSLELDHVYCSKFSVGSDKALRAWARAFGDLLNCILKTECTILTVTNGCYFADAYELSVTLSPTHTASWLGRLPYRPRRAISAQRPPEFQRVSEQGVEYVEIALPRDCSRSSRLTCLHIHSTTLLLPPGLSWTLEVLRSCPISRLTFSEVTVDLNVWTTILPLIASAAPSLTSVGFLDILIMPEHEILAFIPKLPNLVELDISTLHAPKGVGDGFYIAIRRPQLPYLPRLRHLRTTPTTMCHLLARESLLPSLEKATMLLDFTFVHCPVPSLAKLLITIIEELASHPRHPMLALALIPASPPVQQGEMEPDVRASLDCVQGLEFEFTISPDEIEKLIGNVVLWVAVFRRVKSVTIKMEPQADVGTLPQRLASSIARTEFLRAIEVNGMEYCLVDGRMLASL